MNILLVYAHPEPKAYTRGLLDVAVRTIAGMGHRCEISDLYAQGFDPLAGRHDFSTTANPDYFEVQIEQALAEERGAYAPEIAREQARVARADMMIFFFPLWWGGPPAMLKGWFERVMSYGFAYVDGARYDRGLFKGRSALICVATGGTAERFSEGGTYGAIDRVLWPFQHCALKYTGLDVLDPFVAYAAPRVSDGQRRAYFKDWELHLRRALEHAALRGDPKPVRRGSVALRPLQFRPAPGA